MAYKRKHNPYISFKSFTNSSARCATQRDFNDLNSDLASGNLPAFTFVVPNQAHDDHDTTISYSGIWFSQFIQNVTKSPVSKESRVLIHVTYDEDDTAYTYYRNAPRDNAEVPNPYYNATCLAIYHTNITAYPKNFCAPVGCTDLLDCTLDVNDNKVYSILLGNALPSNLVGTTDNTNYTHYSILATMEANWGIGNLGRGDVGATVFTLNTSSTSKTTSNACTGLRLSYWMVFFLCLTSLFALH